MTNEKMYLKILENISEGVYFVDLQRKILFWNSSAEKITGYIKDEVIGQSCDNTLLRHIDKDGLPLCTLGCPLHFTLTDGLPREIEAFLKHRDGYRIPISAHVVPIKEKEKIIGAIEIFAPNSPIVYDDALIERLSDLAMNDQLTGIANRRKLENYLQLRLNEMRRLRSKYCVLFLDIDGFSVFNNLYGHDVGDEVLKAIAQTIQKSVRKYDQFGRWGGEEFVGIFAIRNDYEAVLIGEKIRALIANIDISAAGKKLAITASVGITVGKQEDTVESVLKRADELMYQSKHNGKNRVSSDVSYYATARLT